MLELYAHDHPTGYMNPTHVNLSCLFSARVAIDHAGFLTRRPDAADSRRVFLWAPSSHGRDATTKAGQRIRCQH